jgi:hypothetical protein
MKSYVTRVLPLLESVLNMQWTISIEKLWVRCLGHGVACVECIFG